MLSISIGFLEKPPYIFVKRRFPMVELEIYAPGVREMDKIMLLDSELGTIPDLRFKIDSNHDIIYMEFDGEPTMTLQEIHSLFRRLSLTSRVVGSIPPELQPKSKTQRLVL